MTYEELCSFEVLYKAYLEARKGKRSKSKTIEYEAQALACTEKLSRKLAVRDVRQPGGDIRQQICYVPSKFEVFAVYEPKCRMVHAPAFVDKVVLHALVDNILYDALTKSFIRDSHASQTGKGTDDGLMRLKTHMVDYYRRESHGADGWVLKGDVRHFFASIDHRKLKHKLKAVLDKRGVDPRVYELLCIYMHPSRGPRKGSRGHSQRSAGADYGHHQQALRLRRTEMARNSVCKTAILFVFGGLAYFGLEVLFRGHSHWTMFVLGGFLFLILGELNEGLLEWDTPLIWQGVLGSAIVTGAELVTGMILNVWLGLGVWDYSGMPFNYKGQICLPFGILWIFVSIAAIVLDDWLRYWLFGEEHPHYTLFRRGESR